MLTFLARMLIFVNIALANIYLVVYQITTARLIAVTLFIFVLVLGLGRNPITPTTRRLVTAAVVLVLFKFLVDAHNTT